MLIGDLCDPGDRSPESPQVRVPSAWPVLEIEVVLPSGAEKPADDEKRTDGPGDGPRDSALPPG